MNSSLIRDPDLAVENDWNEARLLVLNIVDRSFFRYSFDTALSRAASCEHPDARWLTALFDGKDVNTREEVREMFLALGESDARGLCFAALLSSPVDMARLRRSAELGEPFAQARLAGKDERFSLALRAAAQGEPEGFSRLGFSYRNGVGCEKDLEKAKENFMLAAKLGQVHQSLYLSCFIVSPHRFIYRCESAMINLGDLLKNSDPQKWYWAGCAARRGFANGFISTFSKQVQRFSRDSLLAPVVFAIGQALHGHVKGRSIFGVRVDMEVSIADANRAVSFFLFQCVAARQAVDIWSLIAKRLGVVKDVRVLIAKEVWEARELANYKQ